MNVKSPDSSSESNKSNFLKGNSSKEVSESLMPISSDHKKTSGNPNWTISIAENLVYENATWASRNIPWVSREDIQLLELI
jgi:hypothetical protein